MRLFNRAPKALSSMDRNILGANRCFLTPDSDSVRGDNIRFCPGEQLFGGTESAMTPDSDCGVQVDLPSARVP